MYSDGEMESIYKEVLRWKVASKEIEEEVRERVRATHSLGLTCVLVSGYILFGIVLISIELMGGGVSLGTIIFIVGGIICILGGIIRAYSYYNDEKYLSGSGKQEEVRAKTVLLHGVISRIAGMGRNSYIKKYLKISYPMEGKTIVRELSDFYYDRNLLENDLAGLYGKKITLACFREEFYVLNHVYLEFAEEELNPEESTELLKNADAAVKNLVESIDEKQMEEYIIRKKLEEEYKHQYNYKMAKYSLNLLLFVDGVIGYISLCFSSMHTVIYMMAGCTAFVIAIPCLMKWISCKKHSGRIWSKRKLRKVHGELERGKERGCNPL